MSRRDTLQSFCTPSGAQVFCIPLQAFPNFKTTIYLVKLDAELVLVDTGSGSEQSNADLETGFEQISQILGHAVSLADLTTILVTHGHIDHYGGLVYLSTRTKARLGVHELDQQILTSHEERLAVISRSLGDFLVDAGIPDEERGYLMTLYKFTKALYHSVPVDFTYQAAGMHLGLFDMLHIPGHCPGHVAIRLDDIIFSGDHVLEGIITHQSPERLVPYMGLGHYLESLDRLEQWSVGVRLVLAGHGDPIQDLPGRMEFIRQAVQLKLKNALEFLVAPHTIAETTAHLYPERAGYNGLLVLEKTGAYVEYLYQRGLLEITNFDQLDSGKHVALFYRRKIDEIKLDLD